MELSATDLAARISKALEQGYLPEAQVAINQMLACNIRALRVNGVDYPISGLNTTVSRLASGQDVPKLPRPTGAAVFLIEPGGWAAEGAKCTFGESTTPIVEATVFPVGSQGA